VFVWRKFRVGYPGLETGKCLPIFYRTHASGAGFGRGAPRGKGGTMSPAPNHWRALKSPSNAASTSLNTTDFSQKTYVRTWRRKTCMPLGFGLQNEARLHLCSIAMFTAASRLDNRRRFCFVNFFSSDSFRQWKLQNNSLASRNVVKCTTPTWSDETGEGTSRLRYWAQSLTDAPFDSGGLQTGSGA